MADIAPRDLDRITMRFARAPSGARLAWARHGAGPPLVRVAHWLTHVEREPRSAVWRPWLARYGRRFSLVRYDECGYGMSDQVGSAADPERAVDDLAAVIEATGEQRVALLGISGAAPIAITYAARNPQRVSHLVLLGGYLCGLFRRDASAEALAYFEAQLQLMEQGWGRSHPAVQQFFTSTLAPDASPDMAQAFNELQRLACDGRQAAQFMRLRASLDVRGLAPSIACPCLVLHAEGDLVVEHAFGRELAAAIPGARFQTLPGRNHVPLAGDAAFERCFAAMEDFILGASADVHLTPRELELAALVAAGLDNAQIGARMAWADKTVRNSLSALYAKLGVEGRPQAIVRTRDLGLG